MNSAHTMFLILSTAGIVVFASALTGLVLRRQRGTRAALRMSLGIGITATAFSVLEPGVPGVAGQLLDVGGPLVIAASMLAEARLRLREKAESRPVG